jgi:hypothetical protein
MAPLPEISRRNGKLGGRPRGAANVLTRKKANEICESGEAPLDVMLDNLRFWHRTALGIGERLQALIASADEGSEQIDKREAMKLTASFLAARENSQKCAVEAAPYVHPKLASIQMNMTNQPPPKEIDEANDTPEQAAEAWAAMVATS